MDPRKGVGGTKEASKSKDAVQKVSTRSGRTIADMEARKKLQEGKDTTGKVISIAKPGIGKAQRVLKDLTNQKSFKPAVEVTKKSAINKPASNAGPGQSVEQQAFPIATTEAQEVEKGEQPALLSPIDQPRVVESELDAAARKLKALTIGEHKPSIGGLEEGLQVKSKGKHGEDSRASVKSQGLTKDLPLTGTRREQRKLDAAVRVIEQMERQRLQRQELERKIQAKKLHAQQLLRKAMKSWKCVERNVEFPAASPQNIAPPAAALQSQAVDQACKGKQKVEDKSIHVKNKHLHQADEQINKRDGGTSSLSNLSKERELDSPAHVSTTSRKSGSAPVET
jgi:hypothetical protein